jgi:hypothetical protein
MKALSLLFGAVPGLLVRLFIFAAATIAVALLKFIASMGWVANDMLVLLGLGAITRRVFDALARRPDPALDGDMRETRAS